MSTVHEQAARVRSGIHAAALLALAQHMAEHLLPAPTEIYLPVDIAGWAIDLAPDTLRPWLDSVCIDEEHSTTIHPIGGDEPYVRSQWQVRLPSNGTRLTITARRAYPLTVSRPEVAS